MVVHVRACWSGGLLPIAVSNNWVDRATRTIGAFVMKRLLPSRTELAIFGCLAVLCTGIVGVNKIPQDLIRSTIGKALDSLYSTGERDKFRTRFERSASGGTEIFISHRGSDGFAPLAAVG